MDIDLAHLIGELHLSIVQPKAHHLNTQLPHTKECYLSLLGEYFLSHCLLPQLFQFYKDATDPSFEIPTVGPQLEKLDQLRVEGCHKLYMGTLAYSPILSLWFNRIILWSLVFKKLSRRTVTSCCI